MGIEQKHAYRFGYLKSEEWQTVRVEALARTDAVCQICGFRSIHNDAHHVHYPDSVWDTKQEDLVILCRKCHELMHEILEIIPKQKERQDSFRNFRIISESVAKWGSSKINEMEARRVERRQKRHAERQSLTNPKRVKRLLSKVIELEADTRCEACKMRHESVTVKNVLEGYEKIWPWRVCDACYAKVRSGLDSSMSPGGAARHLRNVKKEFDKVPLVA